MYLPLYLSRPGPRQQRLQRSLLVPAAVLQRPRRRRRREPHLRQLGHFRLGRRARGLPRRVVPRPRPRRLLPRAVLGQVLPRDHGVLRVPGLGRREQRLQRQQRRLEREGGRPGVLEDVEADGARGRRDVWVPDFRHELHLGGHEGVLVVCLGGEGRVCRAREGEKRERESEKSKVSALFPVFFSRRFLSSLSLSLFLYTGKEETALLFLKKKLTELDVDDEESFLVGGILGACLGEGLLFVLCAGW